MTHARSRAGSAGTLVIVILLVTVLSAVTLALVDRGHGVHRRASDEVIGLLVQAAAESALEEAAHRVALAINDPAGELAARFRGELSAGRGLTVPPALVGPLERTAALLAAKPYEGRVIVDPVSVRVEEHEPVHPAPNRGGERVGTVIYEATARGRSDRKLVRRVRVEQLFRMALATVPRPFDRLSFCVAEARDYLAPAQALLDSAARALTERDAAFRGTWTERDRKVRDALDAMIRAAGERDADFRGAALSRGDTLAALREARESRRGVAETLARVVQRLRGMPSAGLPHLFEDRARGISTRVVAVRAGGAPVALGEAGLDVASFARPLAAELERRVEAVHAAEEALTRELSGKLDPQRLRRAAGEAARSWSEACAAATRALDRVQALQEQLDEYHAEFGPGQYRSLQALFAEKFTAAWLDRKVMWNVRPEGGETANEALDRTWERVDPERQALSGLIRVTCPAGNTLVLSDRTLGTWKRGRAVLVVDGDCRVEELSAREEGLLVVIARGRLAVRGTVAAALVGLGDVDVRAARIRGALLAARAPVALDGTLESDPRLAAGAGEQPDPEAVLVALSPARSRAEVERSERASSQVRE